MLRHYTHAYSIARLDERGLEFRQRLPRRRQIRDHDHGAVWAQDLLRNIGDVAARLKDNIGEGGKDSGLCVTKGHGGKGMM